MNSISGMIVGFVMMSFGGAVAQSLDINVLPYPTQVNDDGDVITLPKELTVYVDPESGLSTNYLTTVMRDMGLSPKLVHREKQAKLSFRIGDALDSESSEAYRVKVNKRPYREYICAESATREGLLAALQTIRQLANQTAEGISLPVCDIQDAPRFPWRAYMLDESRHFHGKVVVKRLLDEMARLKLNTFHWHLVDDPGWRIEIKRYPRLTDVASKGNHTLLSQGINIGGWDNVHPGHPGQFYTQEDIREIVRYADERGILIIPEIEMPGHASASIFAYPWLGASSKMTGIPVSGDLYDVTDSKVEEFLHHVLDEVIELFPSKIIHIGGDEANYVHWQNNGAINEFMKAHQLPTYSDLQVWAINRMSRYIAGKGSRMIGWNEITGDNVRGDHHVQASEKEKLAEGTIVQFWDGDISLVNKAIGKGYNVVNSNRVFTYLDYSYEAIPLNKAYAFNPIPEGLSANDHHKILGLGCQMWGEFTPTAERVYYQTFPRIAAFAVNAWTDLDRKPDYDTFRMHLKPLLISWKDMGYITDQPIE